MDDQRSGKRRKWEINKWKAAKQVDSLMECWYGSTMYNDMAKFRAGERSDKFDDLGYIHQRKRQTYSISYSILPVFCYLSQTVENTQAWYYLQWPFLYYSPLLPISSNCHCHCPNIAYLRCSYCSKLYRRWCVKMNLLSWTYSWIWQWDQLSRGVPWKYWKSWPCTLQTDHKVHQWSSFKVQPFLFQVFLC